LEWIAISHGHTIGDPQECCFLPSLDASPSPKSDNQRQGASALFKLLLKGRINPRADAERYRQRHQHLSMIERLRAYPSQLAAELTRVASGGKFSSGERALLETKLKAIETILAKIEAKECLRAESRSHGGAS